MWKYDNKYVKFVPCCYSGFLYDILSLNVKMYLWLKLYTVPFFVSGQTYKISKGQIIIAPTVGHMADEIRYTTYAFHQRLKPDTF